MNKRATTVRVQTNSVLLLLFYYDQADDSRAAVSYGLTHEQKSLTRPNPLTRPRWILIYVYNRTVPGQKGTSPLAVFLHSCIYTGYVIFHVD